MHSGIHADSDSDPQSPSPATLEAGRALRHARFDPSAMAPSITSSTVDPGSPPDPVLQAVKELAEEFSYRNLAPPPPAKRESFIVGQIHRNSDEEEDEADGNRNVNTGAFFGTNKPHQANDAGWDAVRAVQERDGALGMGHFRLLQKLGNGDIGSVYLVELRGTGSYFAMKVMDRQVLASRKKLSRAQTEREILQELDHPFLPTLYTHFDAGEKLCLVMDFCPGGDLHGLRQQQPGQCFPESAARFYVAEVLLALEYLHMEGIIYRDLKPENVLVREDGHIMLSDFDLSLRCSVSPTLVKASNPNEDFSKSSGYEPRCMQPSCFLQSFLARRSKKNRNRSRSKQGSVVYNQIVPLPELVAEPTDAHSMSFVGTHEYLAPEIIKGEGHGSAVDWWTLGIFLYELLYAKTPFRGDSNGATLFNVVGQPLEFPESPIVSFAVRDLIRGLLVKKPVRRLGYNRGATELKQHPFFQCMNWALIRGTCPPGVPRPFKIIPSEGDRGDVSGVKLKASDTFSDMDFF